MSDRRALMLMASGGGGGMTFSGIPSIIVKNGRSGTINVNRIHYDATVLFKLNRTTLASGSTATYTNMATDGSHFWIDCSACTTCKYNDVTCDFQRSSTAFQVTIPDDFDATIPFVFS